MKISRSKTILPVFGIPILLGITARAITFFEWLDSPIRYYHRLSEYAPAYPEIAVAFQFILGILTAFFTAYIALRLTGKRFFSCASGALSALYAPAVMYEFSIIPESTILFYAAAVTALVLFCRKNHFKAWHLFLCGIFLSSITLLNSSCFIWAIMIAVWILAYIFKKRKLESKPKVFSALRWMITGAAAAIAISFSANCIWCKTLPEFTIPFELINQANAKTQAGFSAVKIYFNNTIYIFRNFEIPGTLNYYFIRDHLFPLNYLFGPLFLIPAAASGIIMLLFNRKFCRKESILLIYLIAFIIPLCISFPLGKQRLIFLPVFSIFAIYFFELLWCSGREFIRGGKLKPLLVPLIIYVIFIRWGVPSESIIRENDFILYAEAVKFHKGKIPELETYYRAALSLNPGSETALRKLSRHFLDMSKFRETVALLKPYYEDGGMNPEIVLNYAQGLLYSGAPLEAEKVLESIAADIDSENTSLSSDYHRCLAQTEKALKKNKEASEIGNSKNAIVEEIKNLPPSN